MRLIDRILRPWEERENEIRRLRDQNIEILQGISDWCKRIGVPGHMPIGDALGGLISERDGLRLDNARLMRELDGARGACDRLQAQADRVSQANLVLTADLANARHVIDQCEADRNSLAKERDQAKAEAERHLKAAVNLDDARRAEVERNDSLAARIANAVDQLTGPRGFAETKSAETDDGIMRIGIGVNNESARWLTKLLKDQGETKPVPAMGVVANPFTDLM